MILAKLEGKSRYCSNTILRGEFNLSMSVINDVYAKKHCRSKHKKGGAENGRALVFGNLCLAQDKSGTDALKDVTGVILAGGASARMGQDKALLKLGDVTLIERVYHVLKQLFKNVLVVTNAPEKLDFLPCRKITDRFSGAGVLSGLHAGLLASTTERICVVPCDAPFLNAELLTHMCLVSSDCDALVPVSASGSKPLHAVYSRHCLPVLNDLLLTSDRSLEHLLAQVRCRYLSPAEYQGIVGAELSFCDLDFPEEYHGLTASPGAEHGMSSGHGNKG